MSLFLLINNLFIVLYTFSKGKNTMSNDNNKNRSVGRPKIDDKSQKRDKKVMLSLTQDEYEYLVKMQKNLNRPTLTSTILFFMERGQEAVREDFSRER